MGFPAWMARLGLTLTLCTAAYAAPTLVTATKAPDVVAHTLSIRPWADFEPVDGIVAHHTLPDISPELWHLLDELLGPQLVLSEFDGFGDTDTTLLWMRDYHPIHLRRPGGGSVMLSYLAPNQNRSRWLPSYWRTAEVLPLVHENGNMISLGDRVLLSSMVLDDNLASYEEAHLKGSLSEHPSEQAVVEVLARALRLSPKQVHILPPMPGEPTGHIDLYVLPLGPGRVMVPQITAEALKITPADVFVEGREAQIFLDDQARALEKLGLSVVRLPMMAPRRVFSTDEDGVEESGLGFFSPANSLLLNQGGRRLVVVPTFERLDGVSPRWQALTRQYTDMWAKALKAEGWTPYLVDATELVPLQGFFRCLTAPLVR